MSDYRWEHIILIAEMFRLRGENYRIGIPRITKHNEKYIERCLQIGATVVVWNDGVWNQPKFWIDECEELNV